MSLCPGRTVFSPSSLSPFQKGSVASTSLPRQKCSIAPLVSPWQKGGIASLIESTELLSCPFLSKGQYRPLIESAVFPPLPFFGKKAVLLPLSLTVYQYYTVTMMLLNIFAVRFTSLVGFVFWCCVMQMKQEKKERGTSNKPFVGKINAVLKLSIQIGLKKV